MKWRMRALVLLIICLVMSRSSVRGQGSVPFGPINQRQTENPYQQRAKAPNGGNAPGVAIDVSTDLGRGIAAELTQENKEAIKYIKPEILKNLAIFPDKAMTSKLEQLKDMTPAQRRLRNRMWTEIKAGR